jgi:hypothetical protein
MLCGKGQFAGENAFQGLVGTAATAAMAMRAKNSCSILALFFSYTFLELQTYK